MQHPNAKHDKGIPLPAPLAAIWGAFLFEGMMAHYPETGRTREILGCWKQGCIELVTEACAFLPLVWEEISMTWEGMDCDLPGVFEYEVISPLGEWVGNHLLQHQGKLPSADQAWQMIQVLIRDFFQEQAVA